MTYIEQVHSKIVSAMTLTGAPSAGPAEENILEELSQEGINRHET